MNFSRKKKPSLHAETADAGGFVDLSSDDFVVLKESIESHRISQRDLISSLKTLVPELVSSLDLSLQLIYSFNRRPFTPTPTNPNPYPNPNLRFVRRKTLPKPSLEPPKPSSPECHAINSQPGDLVSVVRTMVAVCLLELVPFTEIDSVAILKRLEGGHSSTTPAELAELGSISAVEMALRTISDENGGVQIEEFSVNGKPRVMV